MNKKKVKTEKIVQIQEIRVKTMKVTVVGDTPLISHKFSDTNKKAILDKQMKKASQGKEAKDPQKDYENCIYKDADGDYAFPSAAFKLAAVRAAKNVEGLDMTSARGLFFVLGGLTKIKGKPKMREDAVRLKAGGGADIRYRAEYTKWSAELIIKYNATGITVEQIVNLLNIAGFSTGIGDWRPEKNGTFGMFHVK